MLTHVNMHVSHYSENTFAYKHNISTSGNWGSIQCRTIQRSDQNDMSTIAVQKYSI